MQNPILFRILAASALLGLAAPSATAQSPTTFTKPSGYVRHDLQVGFNLIAVTVHNKPLVSGTIESEAGAVITDPNGAFDTALTDPLATYQIEITSGPQNGAVAEIISSTPTTVTVAGTGLGAGADTTYVVRAAETLNDLFGTSLDGGSTDTGNDTVWIAKPDGSYERYFYSTLGNEFRSTGDPFSAPTKPISVFYPEAMFVQIASSAKTVTFFGDVKVTPTVVAASEGFNLVRVSSPSGQTLAESNLNTFLTSGSTDTGIDTVWLQDGSGGYVRYFYSSLFDGWRSAADPFGADAGTTPLPSAVLIQRATGTGDTAGVFDLPTFFDNL